PARAREPICAAYRCSSRLVSCCSPMARPACPPPARAAESSFEQIDAVQAAGAQLAIFAGGIGVARIALGLDIDGAAPILRRFGRFQRTVVPLGVPVVDVHFLDRAVEVLQLDRAVVLIDRHDLEQLTAVESIPLADSRMRRRHLANLRQCSVLVASPCVHPGRGPWPRGCQLLCLARTSHERRSMLRFTCDAFKTSVRSFAHCAGDKDPDRTRTAATREGAMLDLKFFVVFFVVVDPIALIPLFSRLTQGASVAYQRRMAAKAVVVAAGILLLFALGGAGFLKIMGI